MNSPKAKRYFYSNGSTENGPLSGSEIKQLALAGKLAPTDVVWQEGTAKKFLAKAIPKLVFGKAEPETTTSSPVESPNRSNRRARSVAQRRLFLSCVSHEFRSYRDALASNLAQPGVELRRQEDFVNTGRTILEKLRSRGLCRQF